MEVICGFSALSEAPYTGLIQKIFLLIDLFADDESGKSSTLLGSRRITKE